VANTYTQLAFDNFHQANGPLNPANWSPSHAPYVNLAVLNNVCTSAVSTNGSFQEWGGSVFPSDQYAEITISAIDLQGDISVVVRGSADLSVVYTFNIGGDGANLLSLFGPNGQLGTDVPVSPLPGDVMRLEAIGSQITAYYNHVLIFSFTDTGTASGQPALFINFGTVQSDTAVSLFTAGSITQGGHVPIIPVVPVLPINASLGSPLITPGWPLARVAASDPLAGGPNNAQTPDPNDPVQTARFYEALVQSGHTSDRIL
jgi:hypothetical protein